MSISIVVRNYRREDLPLLVALVGEAREAGSANLFRFEEQPGHWLEHPRSCPEEDLFLAELEGKLVGYAMVHRELERERVILWGAVHPHYCGQGVGARLMEAALAHSETLGASRIRIPVSSTAVKVRRFVEGHGFTPVRYHWEMRLDSVAAVQMADPPQGFELCVFAPGDEPRLVGIQNSAFARNWEFCPNTVGEISYEVGAGWSHPDDIWFITAGGDVAGYCWTVVDAGQSSQTGGVIVGRVRMIGVSPRYRGRGLARVVLTASIAYLRGEGVEAVELSVDRRNWRARKLYESLGFRRRAITVWYQRRLHS